MPTLDPFDLQAERGASESENGCVVFPVWFGTNRKPHPRGDGFSSDRHDRGTHGRVEVNVPEAHCLASRGPLSGRSCCDSISATTDYACNTSSRSGEMHSFRKSRRPPKPRARTARRRQVHVIAHSMGNRGLLRALQRIAANAGTRGKVKFDQVLLAAPDVDRDLFLNLARLYPEHAERTTLYASNVSPAGPSLRKTARSAPRRLLRPLYRRARCRYRGCPRLRHRPARPLLLCPSRSAIARHARPHPPRSPSSYTATHFTHSGRWLRLLEAEEVNGASGSRTQPRRRWS
jgi:hypothetical protein